MATFSDLILYFESLAASHKKILHSPQEKHFFRMELDEVLSGINSTTVKYPLFILEGYGFDFTDNHSDNLLKNRSGAFILLDHVSDISDFGKISGAWDEMEQIATDILVKIYNDKRSRAVPVIQHFDFSSVRAGLIRNEVGKDVGIRITYSITSPVQNDVNSESWL